MRAARRTIALLGLMLLVAVGGFVCICIRANRAEHFNDGDHRPAEAASISSGAHKSDAPAAMDGPVASTQTASDPGQMRPHVPADENRREDPPLQDLPIEAVQIEMLEGMYGEDSHDIVELPAPAAPMPLRVRMASKEVGRVRRRQSVSIQNALAGIRIGSLMYTTERLDDVNETDSSAVVQEHETTLASFLFLPNRQRQRGPDFGVESVSRYALSADNDRRELHEQVTIGTRSVSITENISAFTKFPDAPLTLGKRCTVVVTNEITDQSSSIMDEPSKLEITPARYVLFDGRQALEVRGHMIAYSKVVSALSPAPILSKEYVEGKYYVDVDSGEILWLEVRSRTANSSAALLIGGTTTYRQELIRKDE